MEEISRGKRKKTCLKGKVEREAKEKTQDSTHVFFCRGAQVSSVDTLDKKSA